MHELAIVIPAFKPDFFREALESIAAQRDRRFRVYVGDDAGPDAIRTVCGDFPELDLEYHRFSENLGSVSLTRQWDRCIELTSEPWVWLFSDDDVMDPECVESFYQDTRRERHDVFRFQTSTIDAKGSEIRANALHPSVEAAHDFVLARLEGRRDSFVVEYIFRRSAWEALGGFPDYPVGWCADDAAWFLFAEARGIGTLGTGRVSWRASGRNITDANQSHQREKLDAASQYLDFVDSRVRDRGADDDDARWSAAIEGWWIGQLRYLMPMGSDVMGQAQALSEGRWAASGLRRRLRLGAWNLQAMLRSKRSDAQRTFRGDSA